MFRALRALPKPFTAALMLVSAAACGDVAQHSVAEGTGPNPLLPPPNRSLIPTIDVAKAEGWPEGGRPDAAEGLRVRAFAGGLDHPRWLYVLPNGDVLVAETNRPKREGGGLVAWIMAQVMEYAGAGVPSADRISLLRDTDGDGAADARHAFLTGLRSPFGMALVGGDLYVANTDALMRFKYEPGATRISGPGEKVADLPAGAPNRHWTKSLLAGPEGRHLYVGVGSNSDHGENGMESEQGRAAIWQVDIPGGAHRVFASGLRNPVGMDWEPATGVLWTAVNERDELGSDLVPDYMTRVREGAFYGWPYSYYGQVVDPRVEPGRPDLVAKAVVPDYALGPHTASLGLVFAREGALAGRFGPGAFVGQHGSWNRDPPSGYRVVFVPFRDGMPAGQPRDVLTGFRVDDTARGRPVGVIFDKQGALLVADDVGNVVWRVTAAD